MSLKDLFKKQGSKFLKPTSNSDLTGTIESSDLLEAYTANKETFVPVVDFDDPDNFARYGSAEKYYTDSFTRITDQYPYDGSNKEKTRWYVSSSYIDKHIFDNVYPRTNGFINLCPTSLTASDLSTIFSAGSTVGWVNPAGASKAYRAPINKQYILIKGGPHADPDEDIVSPNSLANLYDADKNRTSNLRVSPASGSTVEFWLKVDGYPDIGADGGSDRMTLFDIWNGVTASNASYGRFELYIDNDGTGSNSAFGLHIISGSTGADTGVEDSFSGINSVSSSAALATATFTFGDSEFDDTNDASITLIDTVGLSKTYVIKNDYGASATLEFNAGANRDAAAENFIALVNGSNGHNGTITAANSSGVITLTQAVAGTDGNTTISNSSWDSICDVNVGSAFTGGTPGGEGLFTSYTKDTLADSVWHHYAFVVKNEGDDLTAKMYVDGQIQQTITKASNALGEIKGELHATLGASNTWPEFIKDPGVLSNATSYSIGRGANAFSGSMDEFRFWKDARTAKEIGRYWFTQVHGGTNSDDSNVDLGVYYKFNEGITAIASVDSIVLDYSGRTSNGTWYIESGMTGSQYRATGSAMVLAGATTKENKDPIVYAYHTDVQSKREELQTSGSGYDDTNSSMLYNTIPSWITKEDSEGELKDLLQIMSSYFDTLHLQVEALPRLKDITYQTGSHKPYFFNQNILNNAGFDTSELFYDEDFLQNFDDRDDERVFREKLHNIKNTIYSNIYNNLIYINKSKGTEKSFRNLIRCFGIDEEFIRLNMYADGGTYTLQDSYRETAKTRNLVNFNSGTQDSGTRAASVYQYTDPSNSNSVSYIYGSVDDDAVETYTPITTEAEIYFPLQQSHRSKYYNPYPNASASLFGCYSALSDGTDYTTTANDVAGFQVYSVRKEVGSADAYFYITGSYVPGLETELFNDVYDNEKWNFAVRFRQEKEPFANEVTGAYATGSVNNIVVEFHGINTEAGIVKRQFAVSGTFDTDLHSSWNSFFSERRRLYAGAHRLNTNGTLQTATDINLSYLRHWLDNISDEEIKSHALSLENYGVESPYRNTSIFDTNKSEDGFEVPKIETLALSWNFSNITGSDDSGQFIIIDESSGSAAETGRYGFISQATKKQHTGIGINFVANKSNSVVSTYIPTLKQTNPENLLSSENIKVLDFDDEVFTRESKPINYYYALEKSPYQNISDEMLNMFATIKDFNNLIGEPINRYRQNYKDLGKLRSLFFEKVGNTPSVERYINFYKWLDSSVTEMLTNLIPASANFSRDIKTVIESHVLERNKYWSKAPTLERKKDRDPEGPIKGIKELTYNWQEGHAPLPATETDNCLWWKERAERDVQVFDGTSTGMSFLSSSNEFVNLNKKDLLQILITDTTASNPKLAKADGTTYQGSDYVLRRLTKPYNISSDAVTVNSASPKNKKLDFMTNQLDLDGYSFLTVMSSSLAMPFVCRDEMINDDAIREKKQKYSFPVLSTNDDIYSFGVTPIGASETLLPFSIFSSSVNTGYNSALSVFSTDVQITNLHVDSHTGEEPLQGPFTEKYVGGRQYRHVDLNHSIKKALDTHEHDAYKDGSDAGDAGLGYHPRPEGFFIQPFNNMLLLRHGAVDHETSQIDPNRPTAKYFREEVAKRPLNIRNIRHTTSSNSGSSQSSSDHTAGGTTTVIGNFEHNYQVVQSPGRNINNLWLRTHDSLEQTTPEVWSLFSSTGHEATATLQIADGDAANGMSEKESVTITSRDGTTRIYVIVDDNTTTVSTGDILATTSDTGLGQAGDQATATFTFGDSEFNDTNDASITIIDAAGTSRTYVIKNDYSASGALEFNAGANANAAGANFAILVNSSNGHNGTITAVNTSGVITMVQNTAGTAGNKTISTSNWDSICDVNVGSAFTGGAPVAANSIAVAFNTTGTPANQNFFLLQIKAAIEHVNGHNGKILVSGDPQATDGTQTITLTQQERGAAGNTTITHNISQLTATSFAGGKGLDFFLPDRSNKENKTVIAERFSAPGGRETMSRGFLDPASETFSVYNSMNYRNSVVRQAYDKQLVKRAEQFGLLSGTVTSPDALLDNGNIVPAAHKVNRNTSYRIMMEDGRELSDDGNGGFDSSDIYKTASVHDNQFVQRVIPQSERQYSWITASLSDRIDPSKSAPYGFVVVQDGLVYDSPTSAWVNPFTFVSQSDFGSYTKVSNGNRLLGSTNSFVVSNTGLSDHIAGDFVGLNTHVVDNLDTSDNTIGSKTLLSTENKISASVNPHFVDATTWFRIEPASLGASWGTEEDALDQEGTTSLFNLLMLNRNGPGGWPAWKQTRINRHPLARNMRKNNRLSILDPANPKKYTPYAEGFSGVFDGNLHGLSPIIKFAAIGTAERQTISFTEPAVCFNNKPLVHRYLIPGQKNIIVGSSHQNILETFSRSDIRTKAKIFNNTQLTAYNSALKIYDNLTDESKIDRLDYMTYTQTVFPRNENAGLGKTRMRQNYDEIASSAEEGTGRDYRFRNSFWNDKKSARAITRDSRNLFNYIDNGQGRNDLSGTQLSTWPMAPIEASELDEGYERYNHFGELYPSGTYESLYTTASISFMRSVASRATGSDNDFPTGADTILLSTLVENGGVPIRLGKYNAHLNRKVFKSISLTSGVTYDTTERSPWYNSYEEYSQDIKLIAQGASIIPEFKISDHIDYYVNTGGDFQKTNNKILSLPGAAVTGSSDDESAASQLNTEFWKTYSSTDFMRYFNVIKDDHSEEKYRASKITMKCSGVKKLLPYNGFYPMNRTVQIASILSQSLGEDLVHVAGSTHTGSWNVTGSATSAVPIIARPSHPDQTPWIPQRFNSLLQPIMAPGVLFNSIKAGIAVDYPIHTGNVAVVLGGGVGTSGSMAYEALSTRPNYRMPFEALVNFKNYVPSIAPLEGGMGLISSNSKINFIEPNFINSTNEYIDHNAPGGDSREDAGPKVYCQWDGQIKPQFEMAMNNFLGESVRFFLKDQNLKSFTSKQEKDHAAMAVGFTYYMDIALKKTENFVLSEGSLEDFGDIHAANLAYGAANGVTSLSYEQRLGRMQNDQRGYIYGPGYKNLSAYGGGTSSNGAYALAIGTAYAPHAPPYLYGESIARVAFTPPSDESAIARQYTIREVIDNSVITYFNTHPDLNTPALYTRAAHEGDGLEVSEVDSAVATLDQMTVSSSVVLDAITRDPIAAFDLLGNPTSITQQVGSSESDRWVIYPKWECPTLNVSSSNSGTIRSIWNDYGRIPQADEGIFMEVRESYPELVNSATSLTKSLVQVMGFDSENQQVQRLGELAEEKNISEAIVAIPYFEEIWPKAGQESNSAIKTINHFANKWFIKIDKDVFDLTRENLRTSGGKIAIKAGDNPLNFMTGVNSEGIEAPGSSLVPAFPIFETSISDMIKKMDKYVLPPKFNFLRNETDKPFVMYMFEFNHTLDQQDLCDIWNNLMPEIAVTAEKQESTISHNIGPYEFFGGRPNQKTEGVPGYSEILSSMSPFNLSEDHPDLRWMVFKVKQKAESSYYNVTKTTKDDTDFKFDFVGKGTKEGAKTPDYSYNWPYDFFSLVELAKIDTSITIKDREGDA